MAARPAIRRSAFGFVTGVGLLLLYVAWLQRAGPGTTCWQRGTASGCDQHLNPLPWLIAGLVLFAVASWVTRGEAEEPCARRMEELAAPGLQQRLAADSKDQNA